MTVITGQNGSNKSTLLRDLVSALVNPKSSSRVLFVDPSIAAPHDVPVICLSGSAADRFPVKENGGRHTDFDVPNYHYIGQRVGTNLLSKKRPLESAISFAFDPTVRERFEWDFYEKAFGFAGLNPLMSLEFVFRTKFRDAMPSVSIRQYVEQSLRTKSSNKDRSRLSPATAGYLLETFSEDDFHSLEKILLEYRHRPFPVKFGIDYVWRTPELSALRLGMISNIVSLTNATVFRKGGAAYSAYELSSGEYHMLTTILALGSGLVKSHPEDDGCSDAYA
ncbi:ATP-binding protein [Rhizobium leguminosarum]|uniref:ATP-binding protein n=1 Tax=Rhizobium leguminosarum TaxID=384 RepID=A0A4Q8XRS5_RHILE|nr:ATP-binding protein [Rhizobium leguminosarum]TAX64394.1 ATP-binding protein [Rhizobium leguminosarum]